MAEHGRGWARGIAILALVALSGGAACAGAGTGATDPREGSILTGQWTAVLDAYRSTDLTLVESPTGAVSGTGRSRTVRPAESASGLPDSSIVRLTIEGSVRSQRADLEMIDALLSEFLGGRTVEFRFSGAVEPAVIRGTLSIVEGSELNFGVPNSPLPPTVVPLTFVRK